MQKLRWWSRGFGIIWPSTNAISQRFFVHGERTMSLVSRYQTWNSHRRTRQALNALSDRQLEDIGVNRTQIPSFGYSR